MPGPSTPAAPTVHTTVGGYEILRPIGAGGIAEIFLARQPSLDRRVAIKILSARVTDDADIRRRFDREALTIARLSHPNIIHIIDRGVEGGRYYFVMDFVDGDNLKTLLRQRTLTVAQKCDLIVQCLKALDYAHKNGVIHRDIKPANILVDAELNVRVADFGIAQLVGGECSENTSTSVIMGTPAYMSPEQKVSTANVDHATDIYSMGVVLYELLTGDKPLGRFRPASSYGPEIPAALDPVIFKAMAQYPADRYASAVEFKDAILAALARATEPVLAASNATVIREAAKFMGQCQFLDTIKEHPYGATYLVEERETGELFVIKKILRRASGLKEARMLSRLKHPHIVNIFGTGEDEGGDRAIVLMTYARGGSLSDRLVRRTEWRDVAALLDACLDGLDFAHKNHMLHGNLRPSNILISKEGAPLLSDFGLPEHYAREQGNWYGAPERKKSVAGDIYSLGAIMYQMLTNQLPLYDRQGTLTWPNDLPREAAGLVTILGRMLHPTLGSRYRTAEEIRGDLSAFLQISRRPIPALSSRLRHWRHRRLGWSDWLLGFISGVVASVLLSYALGLLDLFFD
jgi:serine/threonine protein kinase